MFFEPSRTGLIIIGASQFNHFEARNRGAFLNGAKAVLKYFVDPVYGLGLDRKTVLDIFDEEISKEAVKASVVNFLQTTNLDDVFLYICGHGFERKGEFYLTLKESNEDYETCLNVQNLVSLTTSVSDARVVAIVDSCSSGTMHEEDSVLNPIKPFLAEIAGILTNADATFVPRTGAVLLTSNNRENIGTVFAEDGREDISQPLFTAMLLDILRSGVDDKENYSLSISFICAKIKEGIPDRLKSMDRMDILPTNLPQFSDQPIVEQRPTARLSRLSVFPNNHPRHSLIAKAAKRVRFGYQIEKNLGSEIERIKHIVRDYGAKTKRLEDQRTQSENKLREYEAVIEQQRNLNVETKEEIAALSASVKIYKHIIMALVAFMTFTLIIAAAIIYLRKYPHI